MVDVSNFTIIVLLKAAKTRHQCPQFRLTPEQEETMQQYAAETNVQLNRTHDISYDKSEIEIGEFLVQCILEKWWIF